MDSRPPLMRLPWGTIEVIMLIVLQITATVVLWLLNPIGQAGTDSFALFLSADLLSFAILSYKYRTRRSNRAPSPFWVSVGYLALVSLLASNLILI